MFLNKSQQNRQTFQVNKDAEIFFKKNLSKLTIML